MAYREIDFLNAGFTVYVPHDWMDGQITLRRHWICPHSYVYGIFDYHNKH